MRYTKISMTDAIIAGAGAAGLMTAITAARRGLSVTVLDPNGKVIHIQDSSFLEEGQGYNKAKVLRFFNNWTPKAVEQKQNK